MTLNSLPKVTKLGVDTGFELKSFSHPRSWSKQEAILWTQLLEATLWTQLVDMVISSSSLLIVDRFRYRAVRECETMISSLKASKL